MFINITTKIFVFSLPYATAKKIATNINVHKLFQVANCEQFFACEILSCEVYIFLEFQNQQLNVPNSLPYVAFNFG